MHIKDWTEPLTAQEKADLKADKEERKATLARIADLEQQLAPARLAGKIEGLQETAEWGQDYADVLYAECGDSDERDVILTFTRYIRAKIAELETTTTQETEG